MTNSERFRLARYTVPEETESLGGAGVVLVAAVFGLVMLIVSAVAVFGL